MSQALLTRAEAESNQPAVARRRRVRIEWHTPHALFIVLLALLGGLVFIPFYYILKSSLTLDAGPDAGATTVQNYTDVLAGGNLGHLIWNTLIYAIGSAVLSIPIGTLLAWIVERTNTPFRGLAYLSAYAGLAVPGVLTVIGWILLLGPQNGILNNALQSLLGTHSAPFNVYSMTGMILVHGLQSVPVVFLLMVGPFRNADVNLTEAGAMSGANPISVFLRISARLAKPTILAVLLLNAITTMEGFETPALIGIPGGVLVLTTQIYQSVHSTLVPRYGLSAAYGVILIVFVALALWYYTHTTRQATKYVTISGRGVRPRPTNLGRWRWLTGFLVLFLPLVLLLPILAMLWASFQPTYQVPSWEAVKHMTVSNYTGLNNHDVYTAFLNSVKVGVLAAIVAVVISAVSAWVITRTTIRFRGLLDYVGTLPLVFPGVVLGMAMLQAYLSLPIPIYGTIWLLVLAFCTKYVPYGMRFASPALLQIGRELEEAASMSGASWFRSFRKVVVPLMAASLTGALVYIFLLSVKELSAALLLYTPGTQLISVQIYNMWTNGQIALVSAFGMVVTVALLIIALAFRRLTARFGLRQF